MSFLQITSQKLHQCVETEKRLAKTIQIEFCYVAEVAEGL